MKLEPSDKIYITESKVPNAGRGVFAKKDIKNGGIIEVCPVVELPLSDPANKTGGVLIDHFFYFGDGLAVALGYGTIYNHSYEPNATYTKNVGARTVEFRAIKNIKADEEITTNYNFGNPNDKTQPINKGVPPPP